MSAPSRTSASAVKAVGFDDFGTDDDNHIEALSVLLESYRRDADFTELGSKMSRFFCATPSSPGCSARCPGSTPPVRRRSHHSADLRHRPAAHRNHRAAQAALRRPATRGWSCGSPNSLSPAAARNVAAEPGFRATRRPVQEGARRTPTTPACTSHDRRRGRGMLAAAAAVGALGVLRNPRPRPDLRAVAGRSGLDEAVSATPQELHLIGQRSREALGAQNPSHLFAWTHCSRPIPTRW